MKPIIALTLIASSFLFVGGTSGCATSPERNSMLTAEGGAPAKQLHTDLVREMVVQGRNYAALAHIEELQGSGGPREELLLLHAQVLARLGRNEQAEREFKQLLSSAFEGEARHGLGLLHANRNLALSLQYLREATRRRPTDARIRNDFGYALLSAGQYQEARLQLATAYELDAALDKYRNNYVLALLLFKEETAIQRVRLRSGMSDQTLQTLRTQAQGWPARVQRTLAAASVTKPAPTTATVAAAAKPRATKTTTVVKTSAQRSKETRKVARPSL